MLATDILHSPLLVHLAEREGGRGALAALAKAAAARFALDDAWAKYINQPGAKFGSNTDFIEAGSGTTGAIVAAVGGATVMGGAVVSATNYATNAPADVGNGGLEHIIHGFTNTAGLTSLAAIGVGSVLTRFGVHSAGGAGRANGVNRRCGRALLADSEARLALSTVLAIEPADIKAVTDSYIDAVSKELPAVRQVIGTVAPSGPEL